MKIKCGCGVLIRDQTDYLPYKAHVISDQDWDDFMGAVDDAVARSVVTSKKEAGMRARSSMVKFARSVWQCNNCGRLFIYDPNGSFQTFLPESEKTNRELFRSRVTITFSTDDARSRAVGFLTRVNWGKVLASGEMVVPIATLKVLEDEQIPFVVTTTPTEAELLIQNRLNSDGMD